MNVIEERNFPYPILLENGGDFIDSSFFVECSTSLSEDKKNLILKFKYEIKCEFILKLINEGKIMPVVNVSQRTYRKTGPLNSNEMSIPMSWLSPNYNVEIMPMLVARRDYSFFYDESMDSVFSYFDDAFEVKRYQIVGYGNFISIELPTNNKVGSIFTISKLKDKDEIAKGNPYIITLDTDVIDIKVLEDIYNSFSNSLYQNPSFNKLLYSSVVYPAIQLAILTIFQDYDSVKDFKWCIAITNKITKAKGVSFTSPVNFSKDEIIEYTHIILESLLLDAYKDLANGGDFE